VEDESIKVGGTGMNIEAYDLDSLRKIVRALQKENEALKSQLKQD